MNPWSNVYKLLSNLSKSEKRHFNLLSSLQEGEKKYLTLFDELEKMAAKNGPDFEWDADSETFLKNRLVRKGISRQLQVLRNYLTTVLLKSLRIQEQNHSASDTARVLVQEGALLRRRACTTWLLKNVKKP